MLLMLHLIAMNCNKNIKILEISKATLINVKIEGGNPGLVVMGGDIFSRGCGFESWLHIMDGHDIFSH